MSIRHWPKRSHQKETFVLISSKQVFLNQTKSFNYFHYFVDDGYLKHLYRLPYNCCAWIPSQCEKQLFSSRCYVTLTIFNVKKEQNLIRKGFVKQKRNGRQ